MTAIFETDYINNALTAKDFKADRLIDTELILPYTWFDVKIKPNDLATCRTINASFEKLQDNLLYLASKSKLPSSKIPIRSNYTNFIATADAIETVDWYNNTQLPTLSATTKTGELTGINHGIFLENKYISGTYNAILAFDTKIALLSSLSLDSVETLSYDDGIDNFTGRVFNNVKSIAVNASDSLFILDDYYKTVYKYDISGLLSHDAAYFVEGDGIKGKLLNNTLGGPGNTNSTFNDPLIVATDNNDYLYVVDSHYIKAYDKNLNWTSTYNLSSELSGHTPVDMIQCNDTFYVLTSTGYIVNYNSDFILKQNTQLTDISTEDLNITESYRQLVKSYENSNIVYVITNKNVFKKFLTRLDKNIGPFLFTDRGLSLGSDNNFTFASIVSTVSGDDMFLNDAGYGAIYKFTESSIYDDSLFPDYEDQLIPFEDIKINREEYINNIVYNKAIGKLIYNHIYFVNNVKSKFTGTYDVTGNKTYTGTRFLLPQEIDAWLKVNHPFYPDIGNYIGINELVLSETINRTLKSVYDLQTSILSAFDPEMLNTKPMIQLSQSNVTIPGPIIPSCVDVTEGAVADAAAEEAAKKAAEEAATTPDPGPWPYLSSYVLTWTGPLTADPISNTGLTFLSGAGPLSANITPFIESLTGEYINLEHVDEWDGPLYNGQGFFTNCTTPLTATLWFDGLGWTVDTADSSNIQSTLSQRLTTTGVSAETPVGDYYWSVISETRMAMIEDG